MKEEVLIRAAERLQALGAVLPKRGQVVILTHDYPDPDAMASSAALHLILSKRFGCQSIMAHSGLVTRAENRQILRTIPYRFHPTSALAPKRGSWPALFVDSKPAVGNTTVPDFIRPIGVIDHHPAAHRPLPPDCFADVRPETGACVSLLWEYLQAADIAIPPWLASCMVYASVTETMDFTRPFLPADLDAYIDLLPRANMRQLGLIRNAPIAPQFFAEFQEAIANARIYANIAWSHIAHATEPEIVAQFADRLILLERVSWSFCTAFHQGNLIISFRSDRRGVDCGTLLRRAFGGRGSAGGHEWMAAGMIHAADMGPEEKDAVKDSLVRDILNRIDRRLAAATDRIEALCRPLVENAAETAGDSRQPTPV
jgi:nanoRNase/pAp phosphatase (c-di-AMP/oligoRNAs hydrolase)